jgi:hypothetical protein
LECAGSTALWIFTTEATEKNMNDAGFEFHASKTKPLSGSESLRDIVEAAVKEFEIKRPINERLGQATTVMAVWPAGDNQYYGIVILGPSGSLDNLDLAVKTAAHDMVPSMRKIGIE